MRKKLFGLILFALLLFTLPGCFGVIPKLDASLKLGSNEAWDFTTEFHVPESLYYMSAQDFENELTINQQEARADGIDFDWRISDTNSEGNVVVSMTFSGRGYQILNQDVFESNSITVQEINGEKILYFSISTYGTGFGEFFLFANESTFTLDGGEIISTNGTRLDNNTVVWYNPSGVMTAEMKLPGGNALGTFFIIAGLLLVGIAGYNLLKKRSVVQETVPEISQKPQPILEEEKPEPAPPVQEATSQRYCMHCGSELPSGAKFCIACGNKQQ